MYEVHRRPQTEEEDKEGQRGHAYDRVGVSVLSARGGTA